MVLFQPALAHERHPRPVYARSGAEIPQPTERELEMERHLLGDVRSNTIRLLNMLKPAKHRSLVVRSVSAHPYNCAGLVFSHRRAWIDITSVLWILHHDGYRLVADSAQLLVGDIALYAFGGEPNHVGLVTHVQRSHGAILNVRVLSKWGYGGEVEHDVHDVPDLCGRLDSYWSERVALDV